ncbi:acyl-CoA thioester hydrolase [Alkalibacterium subtropicum]|uniref:Acyl-CoA thioester hydrolase n=1 Tax=Alkalibacterium subtropicum TaxID=753702 RepID=A0A1I1FE53_9LACT|nr:thioesterase family protein [Alkalibacterium subtropicum]SFB97645.1 acyl-CoA thioester hydrolase [Alkalibacterium subtropicum]
MDIYRHKVHYYETDQMQIVHHSNYIRWFEEARTHLMDKIGFSYQRMEDEGIVIPVLGVNAEYKTMSRYGETVEIEATVKQFSGVKLIVAYVVRDQKTQAVRALGETKHAFLDKATYRPLSLKRKHKELYNLFNGMVRE